jgi:leucyl-tRNA synthetase
LINWLPIFKKKKSDVDSFDHERVTTGHSLLKALIQANVVADSTVAEIVDEVAATEVVAETVDEAAATEVAVAETVEEAAVTEVAVAVAVAETVDEVDSDNVVKAAVAALVDTEDYSK